MLRVLYLIHYTFCYIGDEVMYLLWAQNWEQLGRK